MRAGIFDRLFVISLYIADGQTNTFHDRREANNGAKNGLGRVGTSNGSVRCAFVALCSCSYTWGFGHGQRRMRARKPEPSLNDPASQPDVLKA